MEELGYFLRGENSVSCSDFHLPLRIPVRPMDPFTANNQPPPDSILLGPMDFTTINNDLSAKEYIHTSPNVLNVDTFCYVPIRPDVMTVNRSDLFLHRDEIVDMETKHPELVGAKFNPNSQEQKRAEQSNTSKASSDVSANSESVDMLLNNDASDSTSHSSIGLETAATLDKQLSLPQEIIQDEESNLMTQAEKPTQTKQPKKRKDKSDLPTVGAVIEVVDSISLVSDDKDIPLSKRQIAPGERYLSLWQIIGNNEKAITGIIPMSRTKWYGGIKDGIFPKQKQTGREFCLEDVRHPCASRKDGKRRVGYQPYSFWQAGNGAMIQTGGLASSSARSVFPAYVELGLDIPYLMLVLPMFKRC